MAIESLRMLQKWLRGAVILLICTSKRVERPNCPETGRSHVNISLNSSFISGQCQWWTLATAGWVLSLGSRAGNEPFRSFHNHEPATPIICSQPGDCETSNFAKVRFQLQYLLAWWLSSEYISQKKWPGCRGVRGVTAAEPQPGTKHQTCLSSMKTSTNMKYGGTNICRMYTRYTWLEICFKPSLQHYSSFIIFSFIVLCHIFPFSHINCDSAQPSASQHTNTAA